MQDISLVRVWVRAARIPTACLGTGGLSRFVIAIALIALYPTCVLGGPAIPATRPASKLAAFVDGQSGVVVVDSHDVGSVDQHGYRDNPQLVTQSIVFSTVSASTAQPPHDVLRGVQIRLHGAGRGVGYVDVDQVDSFIDALNQLGVAVANTEKSAPSGDRRIQYLSADLKIEFVRIRAGDWAGTISLRSDPSARCGVDVDDLKRFVELLRRARTRLAETK